MHKDIYQYMNCITNNPIPPYKGVYGSHTYFNFCYIFLQYILNLVFEPATNCLKGLSHEINLTLIRFFLIDLKFLMSRKHIFNPFCRRFQL